MLPALLLILLILDSFVLIAAILLQAGTGSGMAASFGGVSSSPDAFIGTRQAGNLLTKITWWSGGLFLAIAFVLQIVSVRPRAPKSVLEQGLAPAPAAPAPTSTAPVLPFTPAPGTATPGGASKAPANASAPSGGAAAPTTPAPRTTAPVTPAPVTPAPVTPAPGHK